MCALCSANTRECMSACDVGAKAMHIPKGTIIQVDVWAVHHDKEVWGDDVEDFRPERYILR